MKALAAPATGPVLALGLQIMDEYRVAVEDPDFGGWLADGAPSADADTSSADAAGDKFSSGRSQYGEPEGSRTDV